jgi:hypothetical protein
MSRSTQFQGMQFLPLLLKIQLKNGHNFLVSYLIWVSRPYIIEKRDRFHMCNTYFWGSGNNRGISEHRFTT